MKENVLEVKIVKMNDEYSCMTITRQDDSVIKRGKFKFTASNDVEISSISVPQHLYLNRDNILYIRGLERKEDYKCLIIPNQDIPLITEAIKELNEKYGKPKRWRAKEGKNYCYITDMFKIFSTTEVEGPTNNKHYENGNYFSSKEQAEECKKRIKKVIDDYHQEIGE
ncbi:hypothetical protein [Caviibacter abscessus]|uniref:hypothetical protein n=1 Tax=Caviibacter abscessus TaxID=1766719 RepID=UPI000839A741|nr:hypothetical protein [Caviibacter abscessus]